MSTFSETLMLSQEFMSQPASSAVAPAFPGRPNELLHEASGIRGNRNHRTFDGVYEQWLAAARRTVQEAALAVLQSPASATAVSRLAQAELAAGEEEAAAESAIRLFGSFGNWRSRRRKVYRSC